MPESKTIATKGFGKTTTGDYHRPRRPNPETIRYLRSLPLDLTTSLGEIRDFVHTIDASSSSAEYPISLAAALSAVEELKDEIASLAGDEHASESMEIVVRLTAPFSALAARQLLTSCAGYAVFLATHRYGSHLLQTILCQCAIAEDTGEIQDLALHPEAPVVLRQDDLPSLADALSVLHAELEPHSADLAVHVCGSHILRTLACLFGGFVPAVRSSSITQQPQRRGGKSKAKKVPVNATLTGGSDNERLLLPTTRFDANEGALQEMTTALTGKGVQSPGRLQEWACDASASPLLIVLLRVWTRREAETMVVTSSSPLVGEQEKDQEGPNRHLHRLPAEVRFTEGSQAEALAHRLLCWQGAQPAKDQSHAGDVIYGLAGEPRGSHVLDTLLRISSDSVYASILHAGDFMSQSTLQEYIQHDVSNFVIQTLLATIRTSEEAVQISKLLEPDAHFILNAENRRRGILWRWAEMAVKFPQVQPLVMRGITSALERSQNGKLSKTGASVLLGIKDSNNDERLILNVEGTRALFHILCFQSQHVKSVVESLLSISANDLERLARDGLGSRCVWDAILADQSPAALIHKKLLIKLKGRWVALATDRVGHHIVRKLFVALSDTKSREALVEELSASVSRLEGNVMGRKIAASCLVRDYIRKDRKEWERCVTKALKGKDWLEDMLNPSPQITQTDSKRKRHIKIDSGTTHDKSKRIKEMSFHDIVDAISKSPQK